MSKGKNIRQLKAEVEDLENSGYQHYEFLVENDGGFLSIVQKRQGERKQKIIIQHSQARSLITCIELVKEKHDKLYHIRQQIEFLKDGDVKKK